MGKKNDNRLSFIQNFLSGGIAGVGSRTFTSPLDVVKIVAQVGAESDLGFLGTFSKIYKEEGLKAFWKGNGVACLRLFPYSAIQFAVFDSMKKTMTDENGKLTGLRAGIAGSAAGITATISVYPLDLVKTRLTVQKAGGKYTGILNALTTIPREEGFAALYKGMSASILGVIPFAGGTFMAYEVLAKMWGKPKSELSGWQNFLNGCMAGAFAQTFSFPFDTVRKKMQAQSKAEGSVKGDVEFEGLLDCFVQTAKKNGILGLWRGTTANLAKVAPYAGLMFLFYEYSRNYFLYSNGFSSTMFSQTPVEGIDQSMSYSDIKKYLASKNE